MTQEEWDNLTESAQWALRNLADMLRSGGAHEVTLKLQDGGVKWMRPTPTLYPPKKDA